MKMLMQLFLKKKHSSEGKYFGYGFTLYLDRIGVIFWLFLSQDSIQKNQVITTWLQ